MVRAVFRPEAELTHMQCTKEIAKTQRNVFWQKSYSPIIQNQGRWSEQWSQVFDQKLSETSWEGAQ